MKERESQQHPSYGMLSFHRITGNTGPLFGSTIPNHNTSIRMELKHAQFERKLNTNWFYSLGKPIATVDMSIHQFSEMITGMNTTGVPVTIRYIDGEAVEKCDYKENLDQFKDEFNEKVLDVMSKASQLGERATEILNKKDLKVADKKELMTVIRRLLQEVNSNLPFVQESFQESVEKTIISAKCEIEGQIQEVISRYGIERLQEMHGGANKQLKG